MAGIHCSLPGKEDEIIKTSDFEQGQICLTVQGEILKQAITQS